MCHRLRGSVCLVVIGLFAAAAMPADEAAWARYVDQFQLYRLRCAFPLAEKVALAAIDEAEKLGNADHLATSCNNLGALYYDTGRFADAETQFQRALTSWSGMPLDQDVARARALNNLGLVYLKTGRLKEAESVLSQVLETRQKTLPADNI